MTHSLLHDDADRPAGRQPSPIQGSERSTDLRYPHGNVRTSELARRAGDGGRRARVERPPGARAGPPGSSGPGSVEAPRREGRRSTLDRMSKRVAAARIARRTRSVIAPAGARGGRSSGMPRRIAIPSDTTGWENCVPTNPFASSARAVRRRPIAAAWKLQCKSNGSRDLGVDRPAADLRVRDPVSTRPLGDAPENRSSHRDSPDRGVRRRDRRRASAARAPDAVPPALGGPRRTRDRSTSS